MQLFRWIRLGCVAAVTSLMGGVVHAATWFPLGPYGGSARSFAVDPADARHVFLGTATGWIYDSHDGGEHWNRLAQISKRNDLVIDHIVADRDNPRRLIVGAYTVDHLSDGGVFISEDYGKNWYSQAQMRGQSVRALSRSGSNDKELVAGTLKGIFRTLDNGVHWSQISPVGSAEIKEVQSIAIDPTDPEVIYAGTWHLPWKTSDGGASWSNIKDGIIDDSDVFSIIVDPKDPKIVYASACSGIYKSTDAGTLFHKVQGIPSAARRTRTLEQDPDNLDIVFAGTTEGLYRTQDAGAHWDRLTPDTVVVNDVYVDPKAPTHVLIATDRGGVYRSEDGGTTFEASNEGFSARQVVAYAANGAAAGPIYVGVVNDKATGGVFQSTDGGVRWTQQSEGLGGRDVFSLLSLNDGLLLAGTGHGIFRLEAGAWADSSLLEGQVAVARAERAPKLPAGGAVLAAPTRLGSPGPARHSPAAAAKGKEVILRHPTSQEVHRRPLVGHARPPHAANASSVEKNGHRRPTAKPRPGKAGHLVLVKGKALTAGHAGKVAPHAANRVVAQTSPKAPSHSAAVTPPAPKHDVAAPERLDSVVYALVSSGDSLFAGTTSGLLRSGDTGQHWAAVTALTMPDVHYVAVLGTATTPGPSQGPNQGGPMVLAASLQRLALSPDGGATWDTVALPADLTQIGAIAIDGDKNLWVGGREGVWLSTDYGATWKTLRNLYLTEVDNLFYDPEGKRVLATAATSPVAFSVSLPDHKVSYWDTGWKLRFVRPAGDHLIGATLFDGVVVQPKMVDSPEPAAGGQGR